MVIRDAQYVRNSVWYLKSILDNIVFDIKQSVDMGANVTGYGESQEAIVTIIYNDYTDTVGAWIKLVDYITGVPDDPSHSFNELGWTPNYEPQTGYEFISNDFPAKNNYNISIYSHAGFLGFYRWILYNEP